MASTSAPFSQKLIDLCAENYVIIEKLHQVIRSQNEELKVLRKDYQEVRGMDAFEYLSCVSLKTCAVFSVVVSA